MRCALLFVVCYVLFVGFVRCWFSVFVARCVCSLLCCCLLLVIVVFVVVSFVRCRRLWFVVCGCVLFSGLLLCVGRCCCLVFVVC